MLVGVKGREGLEGWSKEDQESMQHEDEHGRLMLQTMNECSDIQFGS